MNETTGQRIAQRRRMLGLSQEALGQQLGVSRQAISKWESDTTTPEIGKLIAMSHLFSVSVGWLLCQEEEPAPVQSQAFTEDQLRLLEKVIHQKPTVPLWQKLAVVAVLCVTLLCGVASLLLSLRAVERAEQANDTYRSQISWLYENYSSTQSQLDGISAQLRDLQRADEIFAEYDAYAAAWPGWSGADVTFAGVPQVWNGADTGFLVVSREGKEVARGEASWDGFRVSATVGLEAGNDYEYHFVRVAADGTQTHEALYLPGYASLKSMLSFTADGRADGWSRDLEAGTIDFQAFTYSISPPQIPCQAASARWERLELVLYRNESECGRIDVLALPDFEALGQSVAAEDPDYWSELYILLDDGNCELLFEVPEPVQGDELSLRFEGLFCAGDEETEVSGELQSWHYSQNNGLE